MKISIDDAIGIFAQMYNTDNIDEKTFENTEFRNIVQENLDEYTDDLEDEKPSDDDIAEIIKDALYFCQYGDTSDPDDFTAINEDYFERFPAGR